MDKRKWGFLTVNRKVISRETGGGVRRCTNDVELVTDSLTAIFRLRMAMTRHAEKHRVSGDVRRGSVKVSHIICNRRLQTVRTRIKQHYQHDENKSILEQQMSNRRAVHVVGCPNIFAELPKLQTRA
jgi:hypothetical protein